MGSDEIDLFGNPVRARKGMRGRPSFEVTSRNRNKVKMLLALGWSVEWIGDALECSPATVKRYFRAELKERDAMRRRLDAERILRVYELAEKGNVGAERQFDRMIERNDRMQIERTLGERTDDRQSRGETKGKKLMSQERAEIAEQELLAELDREAALGGSDVRH